MKELVKRLFELNKQKEFIEQETNEIKKQIEDKLSEDGYKDEMVTIVRKAGSTSTSIDLKALEKKEPELYADLVKDYTKTTIKKGSVSYTFKK